jgi:tetratricopeptide (TPR) repeat protein
MPIKTCFVVMGFGTKTDYTKPKTFNLDKTYRNIIKPAALAAGLECVRADEIAHSGNINVPMYERLLNADVVVADVSTYNCNAFYELGVRHALRPYTTIIISEDGMTFPFDVAQIAVRKYHHLGEGIDYEEVERMKQDLSEAMRIISEKQADDSPVYTFIRDLKPPMKTVAEAIASVAATLPLQAQAPLDIAHGSINSPTLSIVIEQAEKALEKNDFIVAKALFADLHEKMPNEVSVVHKLTLATYKAKVPTEKEALDEAQKLLEGLNPTESTDTETLGLLQAVHKRLWNLSKDRSHLDKAIWSSEKGFYLKNDYYNGINLAYLYNVRASISEGPDAVTDFVLAQRTRRRVVDICEALLDKTKAGDATKSFDRDATYWVLATLAEAWTGLGDEAKSQVYQNQALALDPLLPKWMIDTTREQLNNLRALLADSMLKSGLNPAQAAGFGSK